METNNTTHAQAGFAHLLMVLVGAGAVLAIIGMGFVLHARLTSSSHAAVAHEKTPSHAVLHQQPATTTKPSTTTPTNSPTNTTTSTPKNQAPSTLSPTGGTTSSSTTQAPAPVPAPPSVSIDTPTNGSTLTMGSTPDSQYIHYVCTHSEPSGYNGMKVRVTGPGGSEYLSYNKPADDDICNDGYYATDPANMPDGTYTLTITVYDTLGRSATATSNFQLQW